MTGVTSDKDTVSFVFKKRYSDRQATFVATREHPTLYSITQEMGLDGQDFTYPMITTNPQGIGNTVAGAQSASETLQGKQFVTDAKIKYGVITLNGIAILKARGNQASFINLVTRTTDGQLDELGADVAFDLHRTGSGMRGRRASISGNVITLTDAKDVDHFKLKMTIGAAQNADGTSPRTGTAKVVGISRSTKKITLDDQSTILSFQDNDYLFRANSIGGGIEGMALATPLAAPTSGDSYRTVDRSIDVEALAGSRQDDTSKFPEQVIGDLAVAIRRMGKRVRRACLIPEAFQSMVNRLGAKVVYNNPGGQADVGFEEIAIHAAGGVIQVMSDPDADPTFVRVWRDDAHAMKYLDNSLIHIVRDPDGRQQMRQTADDGIEIRGRTASNYLQYDTASHGVGTYLS